MNTRTNVIEGTTEDTPPARNFGPLEDVGRNYDARQILRDPQQIYDYRDLPEGRLSSNSDERLAASRWENFYFDIGRHALKLNPV